MIELIVATFLFLAGGTAIALIADAINNVAEALKPEVVIEENTPGICIDVSEKTKLSISFEEGAGRSLVFVGASFTEVTVSVKLLFA